MRASRSNRRAGAAPVPHRLEAFLEMLAAERGAARLTLAAYRNDLLDLAGFLAGRGQALEAAGAAALHEYLAAAATRRLAPRTLARRLSAIRQFFRFLLSDGARADDPTSGLDSPRLGRPLPKVLSEAEVERLIERAGAWPGEEGVRLRCILELLYATGLRVSELVGLPLAWTVLAPPLGSITTSPVVLLWSMTVSLPVPLWMNDGVFVVINRLSGVGLIYSAVIPANGSCRSASSLA